ncbi:RlpA-like double-psi beta-barrel-protein domain-containing protein-containing protein [Thelephora terrestris]|uniref:RlpA-like double-psi beta-barrel-protein domain-containing protein-containing protein n=1 Tax=Thelephora terrestris TaxID=56493 RepID=A0A9P6HRF5_9AGAM|nr:RlpA-like double-psi beta-barrel-protein domain-containing protein-containing protein [Thelephora terrestris]
MIPPLYILRLFTVLSFLPKPFVYAWINYPPDGTATMTHYDLPKDYIAACGCTGKSTHYPTAALNQMAYGSSQNYGPGCGKCFKLTLLNSYTASPPFFPSTHPSIVIKVTDLCPLSENGWCSATENKTNPSGQYLNFDLAYPSSAISNNFFPSDEKLYGYKDFGVWNITYALVSCEEWKGWGDAAAKGSAPNINGCCPANSTGSQQDTCPSYSDGYRIPPDTTTSDAQSLWPPALFSIPFVVFAMLSSHSLFS